MTNLLALPAGTELVGDYRIKRVLGAGGFGITYLADELALAREVTIKEYFPADCAARNGDVTAAPRSKDCAGDYKWGLDRFIEEAQTLAKFDHPNIVRVHRYFRTNNTGYMVLKFEEGQSFKGWLKSLGRAPRQAELDQIIAPLLDALELIHKGDFLHRDIAPDNIMIRRDRAPVLIDFGSARGEIASQSRTVSALVKPGYSPYEQYATTTSQQGPWTDIYSLGATLYQAIAGKRPPDAPSRIVKDDYVSAREAALSSYRPRFLAAIDRALALEIRDRPQSIAAWRGDLLAPAEKSGGSRIGAALGLKKRADANAADAADSAEMPMAKADVAASVPPPPDAPQAKGRLLDFIDGLRKPATAQSTSAGSKKVVTAPSKEISAAAAVGTGRFGLGYGPPPEGDAAKSTPRLSKPRLDKKEKPEPPPTPLHTAAPTPPVERRRPARGRSPWLFFLRQPWLGLAAKLCIGMTIASLAVSLRDALPRVETRRSATTTSQVADVVPPVQWQGHRGAILALGLARAGRSIVTVGVDRMLRLTDASSGALQRSIALESGMPVAAAISDRIAVITFANGESGVYDLERGEKVATLRTLGDAATKIAALAILNDSEPFLAAVLTASNGLALADAGRAPLALQSGEGHGGDIRALAALPQRGLIATAGADRTVRAWSAETLAAVRVYRGHTSALTALAVPDDNRAIAAGSADGHIRIWSAASTRLIRSFRAHDAGVAAIAYAASGDILASAGTDGVIKVWDRRRTRPVATLDRERGSAVRALAFTADSRRLIIAGEDGSLRAWDLGAVKIARE